MHFGQHERDLLAPEDDGADAQPRLKVQARAVVAIVHAFRAGRPSSNAELRENRLRDDHSDPRKKLDHLQSVLDEAIASTQRVQPSNPDH